MPHRSLITALLAIAALALTATPAVAKGVQSLSACGQNDCASANAHEVDEELIFGGGSPTNPPDTPEGWFRVKLAMGVPGQTETLRLSVLPESGYIYSPDRIGGALWISMDSDQRAFYRDLTAGLTPILAEKLDGLSNPTLSAANSAPPAAPATTDDDGGSSSLPWVIAVALFVSLAAAGIVRRVRRRAAPPATA